MATVTKTLRSSGGDYSLLSTWEATEQTDLVTDGDLHVLNCYDDWPSGLNDALILSGWKTGASNYITIQAASAAEEHGGVFGGGFWWYNTSIPLQISTSDHNYTRLIGVEIVNTNGDPVCGNSVSNMTAERCIFRSPSRSSAAGYLIYFGNSLSMRNTVMECGGGSGCDVRTGTAVIDNCTIIGTGTYGLLTDSSVTLRNTVLCGFATEDVFGVPGTELNNATSDTSISGTGAVTGVVITDGVDFTEPSADDYTPVSGGKLHNAGYDLSGTFTDDIAGNTRG